MIGQRLGHGMEDLLKNRQNVVTGPPDELNERLAALEKYFTRDWLAHSNSNPLQKLWNHKDALATNQLLLLGDAIVGLEALDQAWVAKQVKEIKYGPPNNRKGAAFELLGLNLFNCSSQRVVPAPSNNPDFDGHVYLQDGGCLELSLKNYGTSTHEALVLEHGAMVEKICKSSLSNASKNGLDLRIIGFCYPNQSAWKELELALPQLINGIQLPPGQNWQVYLSPISTESNPLSPYHLSYRITMLIPHHANEQQNLISKLDEASANAAKHAALTLTDVCRSVFVHLPESASIQSCVQWAIAYFIEKPDSLIDLVIFYQPAVVTDLESGRSAIHHGFQMVPGPRFPAWEQGHSGPKRKVVVNAYIGTVGPPSKKILVNDRGAQLPGDPWYIFQSGHIFTVVQQTPEGRIDARLAMLAPGVMRHAVVMSKDGMALEIRGIFPPECGLRILQ